jgi:hypothetical protein
MAIFAGRAQALRDVKGGRDRGWGHLHQGTERRMRLIFHKWQDRSVAALPPPDGGRDLMSLEPDTPSGRNMHHPFGPIEQRPRAYGRSHGGVRSVSPQRAIVTPSKSASKWVIAAASSRASLSSAMSRVRNHACWNAMTSPPGSVPPIVTPGPVPGVLVPYTPCSRSFRFSTIARMRALMSAANCCWRSEAPARSSRSVHLIAISPSDDLSALDHTLSPAEGPT